MRAITKGPEPQSLTTHRLAEHSDYDNYTEKDDLRRALVSEQRGICCYCMERIHEGPTTMKVEHWRSQAHHPDEQLTYRNLLGACLGGEGRPWMLQHCDTRKGDNELRWNPADPAHQIEIRIRYELDGSIKSDDADFDGQLNTILNLNLPVLKNNRKGVLAAILDWWRREKERLHGPVPRAYFERQREMYTAAGGQLGPYCQVAVWWLNQRIVRMR